MKEAELEQIRAQIGKLMAETAKLQAEARWYPVVVAGGLIGGTATIVGLLIKFLALARRSTDARRAKGQHEPEPLQIGGNESNPRQQHEALADRVRRACRSPPAAQEVREIPNPFARLVGRGKRGDLVADDRKIRAVEHAGQRC